MSLKDLKVTDEEFSSYGVISQPDTLTGTPEENKAVFDALIRRVSIEHINKLIDELSTSGAADMGTEPFGAVTATTVQAALEQIYALIGSTYSGTDGAGKVGFSGTSSIQASNVQAAIEAVQANLAALIALLKSQQGAAQVGNAPISGLTATTVQAALAELRDQIQDIVAGSIPSQSVTTEQIQDGAVTAEKIGFTGEDIPTSDTDSTSISSQLSNKPANCTLNAGVNLDLITHSGMYRIITPTNGPSFDFGQLVVSGMLGGDTAAQIAFSHDGAQVEFRCGAALTTTPVWSEWVSLSTATPPQEVPLPLAGGVTELNVATAEKTQEGIVLVNAWVGFDSPVIANTETQVAIMPENMRPKKTVGVSAIVNSGDDENLGFARISIDSGGVMRILSDISFSFAVFSIAFPVGK